MSKKTTLWTETRHPHPRHHQEEGQAMNRRVVLVCGGRNYDDRRKVYQTLDAVHAEEPISRIVTGQAPGADQLAIDWAGARQVEHVEYPADWEKHGRAAGPIRNREMRDKEQPDLVVSFPGGSGTANMIRLAFDAGIKVRIA